MVAVNGVGAPEPCLNAEGWADTHLGPPRPLAPAHANHPPAIKSSEKMEGGQCRSCPPNGVAIKVENSQLMIHYTNRRDTIQTGPVAAHC